MTAARGISTQATQAPSMQHGPHRHFLRSRAIVAIQRQKQPHHVLRGSCIPESTQVHSLDRVGNSGHRDLRHATQRDVHVLLQLPIQHLRFGGFLLVAFAAFLFHFHHHLASKVLRKPLEHGIQQRRPHGIVFLPFVLVISLEERSCSRSRLRRHQPCIAALEQAIPLVCFGFFRASQNSAFILGAFGSFFGALLFAFLAFLAFTGGGGLFLIRTAATGMAAANIFAHHFAPRRFRIEKGNTPRAKQRTMRSDAARRFTWRVSSPAAKTLAARLAAVCLRSCASMCPASTGGYNRSVCACLRAEHASAVQRTQEEGPRNVSSCSGTLADRLEKTSC